MTAAAPERLHLLAHRAARRARSADDWWGEGFTTALASVSLARHPSAHRADADAALSSAMRWRPDARPTTADAAALAIIARAAVDLQRGDAGLTAGAVEALVALVHRQRLAIPELHLALSAWALDELVPDRGASPWPEMRGRLSDTTRVYGVGDPLRSFAISIAAVRFDASMLVQAMLQKVATSPSAGDACVLLWLLTAAVDKLAPVLGPDDSALSVLVARRAGLVNRLVEAIDDEVFVLHSGSVASPTELSLYIGPDEALLVDLALASRDELAPWVTHEEALVFFGREAASAETNGRTAKSRWVRVAAVLTILLGAAVAAAAILAPMLSLEGSRQSWALVAIVLSFAALSMWTLKRDPNPPPGTARLAVFFTTLGLVAWALAGNAFLATPVLTDEAGIVLAAVVGLLTQLLPLGYPERTADKHRAE